MLNWYSRAWNNSSAPIYDIWAVSIPSCHKPTSTCKLQKQQHPQQLYIIPSHNSPLPIFIDTFSRHQKYLTFSISSFTLQLLSSNLDEKNRGDTALSRGQTDHNQLPTLAVISHFLSPSHSLYSNCQKFSPVLKFPFQNLQSSPPTFADFFFPSPLPSSSNLTRSSHRYPSRFITYELEASSFPSSATSSSSFSFSKKDS